ncbi:MAG: AraC family ligand binding domain-containing protein [Treponema sp.]|nr:AraC family ligand binding domain-containing protein [Treponema sp.]
MITLLKWRHTASREFYISERSFTGPLTTPTHMHDFYEFLIIIDGSMSHIRNGKISLLEKNSLTLIFPDDEHFYKLNQDQSTLFINVEFSRKLFHKVVSAHSASTESNQEVWKNKSKILPAALCQAIKSRINFLLSDEIILTGINERNILMGILFDCLTYLQNSNSDEHQAPF